MVNAARGRDGGRSAPTRIVFDEGHHLFDAADSTFAAALTGQETIELRRWIIGPEGKSRGRRRGLAARLTDVASYDEAGARGARGGDPGGGRSCRATAGCSGSREGMPFGPVEKLLAAVRGTVYARATAPGRRLRHRDRNGRARRRLRRGGGAGGRGARAAAPAADRARPAARGGARGCARLARRRRRARGSRARSAGWPGGPRRSRPGSRWRRGSAARPIPISSTGWRSIASTAANMTSASTAAGSIRPGRSPKPC